MAKISTYTIDATPTINDKVIGTDVGDSNITKLKAKPVSLCVIDNTDVS